MRTARKQKGRVTGTAHPARTPKQTQIPEREDLIDLDDAVALLKTSRPTFYRWLRSGRIKGMKVGRQWRFFRADVERFLRGQDARIDLPADLSPLLRALRTRLAELRAPDPSAPGSPELEQATALIAALGLALQSSDIHLSAHVPAPADEPVAVLRCRVDGVLHEAARFNLRLLTPLIDQWKRLASCDLLERRLPQDGRILLRLPDASGRERPLDLRLSFVPALNGETATIRLLDPSVVTLDLARIDYAPADRARILRSLKTANGLILVTGPTGCGKTTVLYCCVNQVAGPSVKTMTVEDPVEYILPWTTQVGLNPAAGLSFPRVIRSFLRSAAEVLMVGEIRDRETLLLVIPAALTGHLVLTTLHAPDAASALVRMMDIGADPFLVADSTRLVISQRLVRLLCADCAAPSELPPERLERAAELARQGGLDLDATPRAFKKPVGCERCARTGYRGRTVITETLELTPAIQRLLRDRPAVDELRAAAVREGMTTMAADGVRRAAQGQTTFDEIERVLRS